MAFKDVGNLHLSGSSRGEIKCKESKSKIDTICWAKEGSVLNCFLEIVHKKPLSK